MNVFIDKIKKLQNNFADIYIYGAGLYGQRVYKILQENQITVQAFIVTNDTQCNKYMFDLSVKSVDEINLKNAGIIIAANRHNSIEIGKILNNSNCNNEAVIYACEYLDNRKIDENYYHVPTIEITTVIGCKINCKFCPQKLLIRKYFKDNPKRDSVMTMDTFLKCLLHLPKGCNLQFCGMAEPFLNPLCADMIDEVYQWGGNIELYTTLVGLSYEKLRKIWNIPIDFVNVHVADLDNYAKIPITEEYFELFEKVIMHKRADGSSFVNLCNAQSEPHPRIKELCLREGIDISTVLHDRAGNLDAPDLIRKQNRSGILSCTLCGQDLNHNVLLPDGTLLLCCMDYGMKHELGNLIEQTYEEIMNGEVMRKIKQGLSGTKEADILCRKCSNATRLD